MMDFLRRNDLDLITFSRIYSQMTFKFCPGYDFKGNYKIEGIKISNATMTIFLTVQQQEYSLVQQRTYPWVQQ